MLKSKVEAILFLTDKPMRAQAIARIVNADVQVVRQSILELIHDYEDRQSGLEITDDNGYMIQVKDEYASITDEFVPMDMPLSLLRTLSAVAIKQPVAQSEIIKIRGAGAYDHIKELIVRELLIKKEDGGRSPQLLTTKKFQEYFRLSHDAKSLRTELRREEKPPEDKPSLEKQLGGITTDGEDFQQLPLPLETNLSVAAQAEQLTRIFEASPDADLVYRPDQRRQVNDQSSSVSAEQADDDWLDPADVSGSPAASGSSAASGSDASGSAADGSSDTSTDASS